MSNLPTFKVTVVKDGVKQYIREIKSSYRVDTAGKCSSINFKIELGNSKKA